MDTDPDGYPEPMTHDEVEELYGANFKGDIHPLIRNIRTNANSADGHHCRACGGPATKKCFKNPYHLCFCLARVDNPEGGDKVICGERFALMCKKGCGKHKFIEGYNLCFKKIVRASGRSIPPPEANANVAEANQEEQGEEPAWAPDNRTEEQKRIDKKIQAEEYKRAAELTKSQKPPKNGKGGKVKKP